MNLENSLKDCISKELEKGVIEKVIAQKLEESVTKALEDMFGWNGEVKKVIESKVKAVMIPYLENYDYSEYITKLDYVLVDVLKNSALENKKLVENFKELMVSEELPKSIKVTDIYKQWQEYVEKEIDKNDLEEDCGCYNVEVSMGAERVNSDWSDYETYMVTFICEKDEKLNFEFEIYRWKKYDKENEYTLRYYTKHELESLKYLNKLEIYMMKLNQSRCKIELDKEWDSDDLSIEVEY